MKIINSRDRIEKIINSLPIDKNNLLNSKNNLKNLNIDYLYRQAFLGNKQLPYKKTKSGRLKELHIEYLAAININNIAINSHYENGVITASTINNKPINLLELKNVDMFLECSSDFII